MGEWTLIERILFKLKQVFCRHKVLIMIDIHTIDDEDGYELWCERCHKTMHQIFYEKEPPESEDE